VYPGASAANSVEMSEIVVARHRNLI
jgi:hypothetical protein